MKVIAFDELKKLVFNDLVKQKEKLGLISSEREKDLELVRLNSLIDSNIALKPNTQQGRTDVAKINDDIERLQIDLLLRFKQVDQVFASLDRHKELHNAIISNLKTNVSTLTDEVMILKDTAMHLSDDIIRIESFRNADSISQDQNLYTDDYGNPVDYSYRVEYDNIAETIKIPKLISINKLIAQNGQRMAIININKQTGSGLVNIKNPNNDISKAIDTDRTTYWEETILADEPINVELDAIKYHKHKFGALCEFEIVFNSMTEFNEINLTPYGAYPIDILAIKKYNTDQPDREEDEIIKKYGDLSSIEIVSYQKPKNLSSKVAKDSVSYQFPTVVAKRIRIIIAQRHYVKNSFIYDKNQYEKNNLWFSASKPISVTLKTKQQGLYNVKSVLEKQWVLFTNMLSKVKKLSNINIEEILFPKQTKLSPMTKYEYTYGLYNVGVVENNYRNMGVYVSNPINTNVNIGMVTFKADEDIDTNQHEIKYFISFVKNPSGKDWLEIQNGETINLLEKLKISQLDCVIENEKFFGTRGNSIKLSHTPFLYTGLASSTYIKVTIITPDGVVLEEGVDVINKTNYNNPSESYKNFSNDNTIEYYFYKNKIYFNKPITKDFIIDIDYKCFVDSVRVKVVFKRKDNSQSALTPILNNYQLIFKSVV